ncbi:Hypothetical predicted protein [Paramuricea clavata]|uniref:Uncharacterized protein n=1 Tax=Paramuricea clavata TaxID=317549 RepID=A0A7D9I6R5_PARCT|nr:Hypothetical predicted protein [Paramuricea clavata]
MKMVSLLAEIVLVIPHSYAGQERLFSVVHKNKTDSRSSLKLDGSLSSNLAMKCHNPEAVTPCYKWQPDEDPLRSPKKQQKYVKWVKLEDLRDDEGRQVLHRHFFAGVKTLFITGTTDVMFSTLGVTNQATRKKAQPCPTQMNEHVETLRRNFTSSDLNVFLVHLQTLAQSEQEHTLKNLQGKELAKILKALGQPAFMEKRKEKQINTHLEAAKGGLVCAKFPDEVCI